ncbi:NAD-dependent epimerase/dehydratase family protein [Anaerococcus vaginalis]|uniref:NAD-dependent epimerase/dehydratase family protein n=1 Tax=Anaerococcus vaginalis TaxID=33037 RepID=UPI00242DD3E7|nr:NAD-dependent epimerase/dehydratase family protein [Anaerococcus vaginalis]
MNGNEKIGILGYGGYIGKYATKKLLDLGFNIIGGQREKDDAFLNFNNFRYVYVDINNKSQLRDFMKECKIIINCTSPSNILASKVQKMSSSLNKIYIDPSDTTLAIDNELKGINVVSCGFVPGLSEYLAYILSKKYFEKIDSIVFYQGGFDGCSIGSFVDMILSASNSSFYSDSYINNGKIESLVKEVKSIYKTPFFGKECIIKPIINKDTVVLQREIKSKKHYFFSVYDDEIKLRFFMEMLLNVILYDKKKAAQIIENSLKEKIRKDINFDKQKIESYLSFEILGEYNKEARCYECNVLLKNVNRICGLFLAEVVKEIVLNNSIRLKEGVNYGFKMLDDTYFDKIQKELLEYEFINYKQICISDRKICYKL